MSELKSQQAKNLKFIFANEGISQKEFAKKIGVSVATVSKWAKGHTVISNRHVEKIHQEYPDYSVEYLRGESEFFNPDEEAFNNAMAAAEEMLDVETFVNKYCLCSIERFSLGETYSILFKNPESLEIANDEVGTLRPKDGTFPYARISRNGKQLVITDDDWGAFVSELSSYIDMRLTHAINRGRW